MSATSTDEAQSRSDVQRFGTFLGVFTPSVLTILGLIMYLRFGWVIGNVGLPISIVIVLLATAITYITALSASAIATNMRVGAGGEYFIISRSLGLELGGAIGIPLFLCRTLSITFYSFGLAESIVSFWPAAWGSMPGYTIQLLTAVIIIIVTALSGKSAGMVLKLQIPIMAAVGLSILALLAGAMSGGFRAPEFAATYRSTPHGFWYVFAVFFPAVTGFTAGIGMSGDLKDPRKSIPRGTLLAVITGSLVYISILLLLATSSRISFEELAGPGIPWAKVALLGAWLVFPGIWGAILSSAFGSVLGGPRVLQALASDGLAPRFLARLSPSGQPTIATWVTGVIALLAVLLGELNAVAQFVTILFLTLYVTINLSAGLEKLVSDPSYRPTIRVPWFVSLLGSIGAGLVMFLINPIACIIAVILELMLYFHLHRRSMKKRWGDVRAGLWVAAARFSLLRLRRHRVDPRNWRPIILLFAGDLDKRLGLVRLAIWFNQNRGLVTACRIVVGDLEEESVHTDAMRDKMEMTLEEERLIAFSEVNVVSHYERGILELAQSHGIAGLQSNTVMFGWPKKRERLESILRIMRTASQLGKSTIIANPNWSHPPWRGQKIDIWWRGKQANGDLMLLLAYLLNLNADWRHAEIRVRSVVTSEKRRVTMAESLETLQPETRIRAHTEVIVKPPASTVSDVIHEYSRDADIVFLGLMIPQPGSEAEYAERLVELTQGLGTTIFVRNAGQFAGHLV